eukprot:jgi/Psemu1/10212/gm1.10212_g
MGQQQPVLPETVEQGVVIVEAIKIMYVALMVVPAKMLNNKPDQHQVLLQKLPQQQQLWRIINVVETEFLWLNRTPPRHTSLVDKPSPAQSCCPSNNKQLPVGANHANKSSRCITLVICGVSSCPAAPVSLRV